MTKVTAVTPAAAQALRLIERQRGLAMELDAALGKCVEARARFEAQAIEMEAFLRTLAREAGFSEFEYFGADRIRRWVRDRGIDAGFGPLEARHLDALKDRLDSLVEVVNAAR